MSKELKFLSVDPSVLKKNSWNPNEVSAEGMMKLRRSIEKNGHIRPILVRELEDDSLEIIGGEHRVEISIDLGHESVPVLNLGKIDDKKAKEILLLDNSRYGEDEVGKLSALLEDIGTAEELSQYLTYSEDDLASLMSSDIDMDLGGLDELDELDDYVDDDDEPAPAKELKTHQTMKFKVDVENAETVSETIDRIVKEQGIDDSDVQVRSGEALMWLVRYYRDASIGEYSEDEELTASVEEMLSLDEQIEGLDDL